MSIKQVQLQRFSVTSSNSFQDILARIEKAIGHPDLTTFRENVAGATTYAELEPVVRAATGPSGLMEFARFDLGEILRKQYGSQAPRSLRIVVGNPLIMKQLVERVPDAGSYAPLTILIDERQDGVHLSYDMMASLLASYENQQALRVARDLDAKVESLLTAAAFGE
jgi:uncharacterized protein (DUF302 family)